jgi:hypothetical protein
MERQSVFTHVHRASRAGRNATSLIETNKNYNENDSY